jgi:hypothetical protein
LAAALFVLSFDWLATFFAAAAFLTGEFLAEPVPEVFRAEADMVLAPSAFLAAAFRAGFFATGVFLDGAFFAGVFLDGVFFAGALLADVSEVGLLSTSATGVGSSRNGRSIQPIGGLFDDITDPAQRPAKGRGGGSHQLRGAQPEQCAAYVAQSEHLHVASSAPVLLAGRR